MRMIGKPLEKLWSACTSLLRKKRGGSLHTAPTATLKWSSIRNGVKFLSFGVPIERRTVAPAPSDCSIASKTVWIPRGFGFAAFSDGSSAGITGSPTKDDDGAILESVLFDLRLFVAVFTVPSRTNGRIHPMTSRYCTKTANMIAAVLKSVARSHFIERRDAFLYSPDLRAREALRSDWKK